MSPTQPSPIQMSPISTPQDLQAMSTQPQAAPPVMQTTAPHQNFLQRILPTIGSVAGYGLGALLAPETGGASLALGSLGSGLGEGAGKALENISSGQGAGTGVGGDILGGAIGGLAGGAANSVLGRIGGHLAGKVAANDAVNYAKATGLNFGGVSSDLQKMYDLNKAQGFTDSMGFDGSDPRQMEEVSKPVVDFNTVYDNALQGADFVNTKDFSKLLTKAQNQMGGAGAPSPVNDALTDFSRSTGVNAGTIPKNMPANQARQLQQAVGRQLGNVENLVNKASLSGTYNGEMQAQLNSLHELYDNLGASIKTPQVNDAIASQTVSDADRAGYVAKYGDKLGNYVADTITNAKSADDLLGPMQQLTTTGKLSSMALDDLKASGTPRAAVRAQFADNGGIMPSSPPPKPGAGMTLAQAGRHAVAGEHVKAAAKVASLLGENGMKDGPASTTANLLSRISNPSGPSIAGAGVTAAASVPAIGGAGGQSTMNPVSATQPQPGMNELNSMMQGAMLDPSQFGNGSVLASLAPMIQQSQAQQGLQQNLAPLYQEAGGAQGISGILSQLKALIPGTPEYAYEQAKQAAAKQGAQFGITPGMLPSFMASPGTAGAQFGGAQNILSNLPV